MAEIKLHHMKDLHAALTQAVAAHAKIPDEIKTHAQRHRDATNAKRKARALQLKVDEGIERQNSSI